MVHMVCALLNSSLPIHVVLGYRLAFRGNTGATLDLVDASFDGHCDDLLSDNTGTYNFDWFSYSHLDCPRDPTSLCTNAVLQASASESHRQTRGDRNLHVARSK